MQTSTNFIPGEVFDFKCKFSHTIELNEFESFLKRTITFKESLFNKHVKKFKNNFYLGTETLSLDRV